MLPGGPRRHRRPGRRRREEVANALTHGVGLALAAVAAAVLVGIGLSRGDPARLLGAAVFSTTLLLLYATSTLYHAARARRAKARLRVLDHCAIYLLIAGSYTPFLVVGPADPGSRVLLVVIWGLALAGLVFKLFFTGRWPRASTAVYLGMGWLALVAVEPMLGRLALPTLLWIVAGGLAYTAGVGFYAARRLPYAHAAWHAFVIAGSACHAIAVGIHL